jgi:hypothetical protein
MDDDDWQFPAPMMEDPEVRGFKPAGEDKGAARLVPDRNIAEGEFEEDGRKAGPSCPFSH